MKEEARQYIQSVVQDFCDACNLINYYSVTWKDGSNESGGCASIEYVPEMFSAHFYLYEKFLDALPTKELNKAWKSYVMRNLAHEIGHCYIWELEGTQRDIQKIATLIGDLFLNAFEYHGDMNASSVSAKDIPGERPKKR